MHATTLLDDDNDDISFVESKHHHPNFQNIQAVPVVAVVILVYRRNLISTDAWFIIPY